MLRKGNALTAIEIKRGQKRIESKGLLVFKKRYRRAKTLIVGTGGVELDKFLETPILKWVS